MGMCTTEKGEAMPNCQNCIEKCPQAEMAHESAKGRMYATKEFITLLKKVESGQFVEVVRCEVCKNAEPYDCTIHGTVHHLYKCKKEKGAIGYGKVVSSDDFCSCGKRKDGDRNE